MLLNNLEIEDIVEEVSIELKPPEMIHGRERGVVDV